MTKKPSPEDLFRAKIIKAHQTRMQRHRKSWARAASMYRSDFYERGSTSSQDPDNFDLDEDGVTVEHNWLYAFVDSMTANICPTNPEVTIRPRRKALKEAAELRTALVNNVLLLEKAHDKMWKLVTRASIFPRAFAKLVWNKRRRRPLIRVINPEFIFFDTTAEEWEDIRYVVEATVITKGEFERRIRRRGRSRSQGGLYRTNAAEGVKFGAYPSWLADESKQDGTDTEEEADISRSGFEWVVVYEYYDLVENKFFHYVDTSPVPLYSGDLPYEHLRNPYFLLTFNDNLSDLGGLSDSDLVYSTIERLNEMSSLQLWHNKASIPITLVHEGLLDDPEAFKDGLANVTGPGQALSVTAKQNVGVHDVVGHTPSPSLPINWADSKAELRELAEFVLGLASYQRGSVGHADVATELALSDTAIRTRNARRQKRVYDVIAWLAEGIIGLYAQFLTDGDERIFVRINDSDDDVRELSPESLGMGTDNDDPITSYDYEARPFNAEEGNSVTQLKTLVEFLPVFTQSPHVNQQKLIGKLLELLKMPELIAEAPPAGPQGQPPGPGMPPGGQQTAAPDMGMQGVPPEMQAALQGGEVQVGSGSAMLDAGLAGGPQPGGGTLGG